MDENTNVTNNDATITDTNVTPPTQETAQPAFEATQPTPDTTVQPAFEAAQPAQETAQPAFEAAQPTFEAAQPTFEATQPEFDAAQPVQDAFSPDNNVNQTSLSTQVEGSYTPGMNTTYYDNTQSSTTSNQSNGLGIASLIMGILSIVSSCCCGTGIIFAILGFIFSLLQKPDSDGKKPGSATGGLITSIIGFLLSIIGIFIFVYFGWLDSSSLSSYF